MWKILIADDEPKIRKGLRKILKNMKEDIVIVGEAEDGEVALNIAKETRPDILLLDICMPFLNGLDLVEEIYNFLPESKIIIVTGHDEFEYAQQALKLKVSDYVLKPIIGGNLTESVSEVINSLKEMQEKKRHIDWAEKQLKRNIPHLKEVFFNDFINESLTELEFNKQKEFLKIEFGNTIGIIITKIEEKNLVNPEEEWDRYLLLYAVQNIIEEILESWYPVHIFRDNKSNIVSIVSINSISQWADIGRQIKSTIEKHLKHSIIVCQEKNIGNIFNLPTIYKKLINDVKSKSSCSPIVKHIKNYIDKNYYKSDLSLQEVADDIKISPTYLSRLLKNEEEHSFVEYLTMVRIKRAIQYMNDPSMKFVDIAEKVGYSTQHYFSTAFKKIIGVSPTQYRKSGLGNEVEK